MFIDLNCDMGELEDEAVEQSIMPYITSANVACGEHAGSPEIMARTVALAGRYGVAIGAHPGYPDRAYFGRVEMPLTPEEIADTVYEQVARLASLWPDLVHVKPHGALYNVAARNEAVAAAIAAGVGRWNQSLVLVGLAGSKMLEVWRAAGFRVAAEAFADRRYEPDGSLRSRQYPDALITDPAAAAAQAVRMVQAGQAETLCVHGDTQGAAAILQEIVRQLREAGITPKALSTG